MRMKASHDQFELNGDRLTHAPTGATKPHPPRSTPLSSERTMSDSMLHRGQQVRNFINMHEDDQVKFWTRHLEVTVEDLREAVEKVGNAAAAVRKQLGKAE